VGWHLNIFHKLAKVWRHLNFPDDGWRDWPGSRRDQCTLAAIEDKRARPTSRASETTLRNWAYRIHKHVRDPRSQRSRAWLQLVHDKHKQAKTAHRPALARHPLGEAITISELCTVLQTGDLRGTLKDPPTFGDRPIEWGEWIWYQFLRDTYSMDDFDFVFHFDGGVERGHLHRESQTLSATSLQIPAPDTLHAVHDVWRREFKPNRHVRTEWAGHYILYRVDQDTFERFSKISGRRQSRDDHSWFGAQRVLRVPVALEVRDDLLNYYDMFPDPADGLYESIGLLAHVSDSTVDIFGYDPFTRDEDGKFLLTVTRSRMDDARGVCFARERADKTVSCYRVWLDEVRKEIYEDLALEVLRVRDLFGGLSSPEARWREFRQNQMLFRTVAQLLSERRFALVNYLFDPPGLTEDDLGKPGKVKAVKPFALSHVYFTANLQPQQPR
jgi:hypothetical protein